MIVDDEWLRRLVASDGETGGRGVLAAELLRARAEVGRLTRERDEALDQRAHALAHASIALSAERAGVSVTIEGYRRALAREGADLAAERERSERLRAEVRRGREMRDLHASHAEGMQSAWDAWCEASDALHPGDLPSGDSDE